MTIKIKDFIHGDIAASYEDGVVCLNEILEHIDKTDIELDFTGVNYVITAFLNPVIGDLILQKGEDIMKKIKISNANEYAVEKIKLVRDGALVKREDIE